jgi:hypothetical protein
MAKFLFLNVTAFCVIPACSLVEVDLSFRGAYFLHHQGEFCILQEQLVAASLYSTTVFEN